MSFAVLAAIATQGDSAIVDQEELVPFPPYVYGGSALIILLLLLLLVTRLDLDR